ncbi:MAG: UvrB/UvrC motif-containing protein [Candidatus Delongbacteria bacterium]|nr:UvrB/UvrC motif-containing protein [Candidatus Delongbacteria bacterium]MCG2761143.1 UvrB/UvrC motif-containing protein [Candidatus Delongbacteria bacterium]
MKCDKCGSSNVVSKIVIQGNKNTEELNLCPVCFQTFVKEHPEIKQGPMGISLNELLLGALHLLNSGLKQQNENIAQTDSPLKQCPNCSLPSFKITKDGTVGCGQCYTFFKNEIDGYLMRTIGTNTALMDEKRKSKKEHIGDLNKKLETAVKTENYEIAALVRDELNRLK